MTSTSILSYFFLWAIVFCANADNAPPGSRYQAALCIMERDSCQPRVALKSSVCLAEKMPYQQPSKCRQFACDFCKLHGSRDINPCKSPVLKFVCEKERSKSSPPPTNKETDTNISENHVDGRKGMWLGMSRSIVIDLGTVKKPAKGWTQIKRGRFTGLIYEKEKNLGIDAPGSGKMCFKVLPKYSGSYFFTAVSYSVHVTDHNDCWVSSSKGFQHYKGKNVFITKPGKWMKGYQNNGPKSVSGMLSTKDYDAHTFIIPNVKEGKMFRVCIAGRSYKYEMFRLVLISCNARDQCFYGNPMRFPVSPCK